MKKFNISPARYITCIAVMTAVATALMYLEFSVPVIPGFIKFDFSELPPLLATYSLGPIAGVLVCLFKNLFHMIGTTTGCVGELSNFLLGACLVVPAGLIYKFRKTRVTALIGAAIGSLVMALMSLLVNYYITYPLYMKLFMPLEAILNAYQTINPAATSLWKALLMFNLPFNFVKGLITAVLTFLIYKPLSPIIKGYHSVRRKRAQTDAESAPSDIASASDAAPERTPDPKQ